MLDSRVSCQGQDCCARAIPTQSRGHQAVLVPQPWHLSTLMLEITTQFVFQLSSTCPLPTFSIFISLNKAYVGCLGSYRCVGGSNLPFPKFLALQTIWLRGLGWPDREILQAAQERSVGEDRPVSWSTGPEELQKSWHRLRECWRGCFVKAPEGSEGRPVLHQTRCCRVRDLLAICSLYPLQLKPHV